MLPFLSGYIIFVIVVLVGMNLILRRKRLVKKRQEIREAKREAIIQNNEVLHQEKIEENAERFVTNNHPEEIEEVQKELGTATKKDTVSAQHSSLPGIKPAPIIMVLIIGAFVAILNQTLINVALPRMMTDLNVTTNTIQWLVTGYMLVNGVLIPITAFLMETFSTRKLFIFAMISFAIGTIICALSPNFAILMTGRVVQGIGAGIIMPLMTNVFLTIFPPEKRGIAMGTMGIAMIFAPAVGPTLSGYLVENYTWRLLFYIVLPIAVADIILAFIFLKNVGKLTFPKFDFLGIIFSTLGFGGLLYGFSEAGNNGWGSGIVVSALIIGIVCILLFIWRELSMKSPMLEFRVFKHPIFALTTVVNAVVTMAMFAAMVLVPVYLQNIRGFTPLQSGLLLLPGAILMGIMSPITGALYDRIGARPLAIVGLLITAVTTFQFSQFTDSTPYSFIMVLYSARMFGMSLLMMPIMTEGLNNLPRHLNSHGTAMANTMRQVAGSLGTAFLVTVMTNRTTFHLANFQQNMTTSNTNLVNQINQLGQAAQNTLHLPAAEGKQTVVMMLFGKIVNESMIKGINDAFVVATILAVIALFLSFFIKRSVPSKKKAVKSNATAKSSKPVTES